MGFPAAQYLILVCLNHLILQGIQFYDHGHMSVGQIAEPHWSFSMRYGYIMPRYVHSFLLLLPLSMSFSYPFPQYLLINLWCPKGGTLLSCQRVSPLDIYYTHTHTLASKVARRITDDFLKLYLVLFFLLFYIPSSTRPPFLRSYWDVRLCSCLPIKGAQLSMS